MKFFLPVGQGGSKQVSSPLPKDFTLINNREALSNIIIDGSFVHYTAMGRGRPVIFLHGWVGSWKCWTSVMKVVSTSYSTYALDFCGFGDTAHNELKYSLDEQVKLLDVFLNELGIGKIVLVGHGLGGLVAMKFATHFRQRVDRIMAVS